MNAITNRAMNTSSTIEPRIIRREKLLIMGTQTQLTPKTETGEKFGAIWSDFEQYRGRLKALSADQKYYGVSFATAVEDCLDYVASMAVKSAATVPVGLVVREVPAATYAVFACRVAAIGPTKRYIFAEWRSKSGYQMDTAAPAFEQYPPAEDTESPVLIHIPIREKQAK